jgi:hypothetical protein
LREAHASSRSCHGWRRRTLPRREPSSLIVDLRIPHVQVRVPSELHSIRTGARSGPTISTLSGQSAELIIGMAVSPKKDFEGANGV